MAAGFLLKGDERWYHQPYCLIFMLRLLLSKMAGGKNSREIKRLRPLVDKINQLDREYQALTDDELRKRCQGWKAQLSVITDDELLKERLDDLLPEGFAMVKNAARRLCGRSFMVSGRTVEWQMIPFDVQLVGGIVLHQGKIAEMGTGEGKTLVATMPLFLNALSGRGVHLVTANDYLAKRDADWVGEIFRFLGLTVGAIQQGQTGELRRQQYQCDITYGTSSEFGFDYLRDNGMAEERTQMVQRGHYFAVVDEVDSLLIDEARTPLIISGHGVEGGHLYRELRVAVSTLVQKQEALCARLVEAAGAAKQQEDLAEAGRLLLKLKMGAPKSKGFLRLMEAPEMRRALDKSELLHHQEGGKVALIELKEELYFTVDEKHGNADLTEKGRLFLDPQNPDGFVLPDLASELAELEADGGLTAEDKAEKRIKAQALCEERALRIHNIAQLLKAYCLYERDVDYVVEEGKVIIVDQFTGRKMPGRRWSDGLHQAVEAKEEVSIDREAQTLATITIQNYFRLYSRLSGMTGTAATEANEFHDIYGLDVVAIPPHRPLARRDANDLVFKTRREKYNAVVNEIAARHAEGQPVLVGTASVEASEILSRMLRRSGIAHSVLNAKAHQSEADIIARAGQRGAVTISTNMAGRGTDIRLGEGVAQIGGLHVIGTERHESRRIDRQLRGRCARQGDPGSSQFLVSFEDDLMRNFGGAERMTKIMEKFGMEDGEELEHPWLNKSVESAQKRVEQRNYLTRKRTLEFDDVMNQQRAVVYGYRNEVIDTDKPLHLVREVVEAVVDRRVTEALKGEGEEEIAEELEGLVKWIEQTYPIKIQLGEIQESEAAGAVEVIVNRIMTALELSTNHLPPAMVDHIYKGGILATIDRLWQEHLLAMDGLREAVHLRALGQRDPLVEYKREGYELFSDLMERIQEEAGVAVFRGAGRVSAGWNGGGFRTAPENGGGRKTDIIDAIIMHKKTAAKVGRNEPCPCGTGRKYKQCCGKILLAG